MPFTWRFGKRVSPLDSVTLDHVISGDTCAPISLPDFEAYLAHKEYSIENLHFLSWYQNYRRKFFNLPQHLQALSPPPSSVSQKDHDAVPCPSPVKTEMRLESSKRNFESFTLAAGPDGMLAAGASPISPTFSTYSASSSNNISSPLASPTKFQSSQPDSTISSPTLSSTLLASSAGFESVNGVRKETQPFRHECMCVVQTFVKAASSKEIMVDGRIRDMVIRDLTWSTHPDIFLPIYEQAYDTLAAVSLPHFLTLSATNVNRPKAFFWLSVGTLNLTIALLISLATILSIDDYTLRKRVTGGWDSGGESRLAKARAWRLFAVPFATLGGMQFYSAYKGFCSDVWGRGRTQLRPWELDLVEFDGTFDDNVSFPEKMPDPEKGMNVVGMDKTRSSSSSGFANRKSEDKVFPKVSGESTPKRTSIKRIPPPRIDTGLAEEMNPRRRKEVWEKDASVAVNVQGMTLPSTVDLGPPFDCPLPAQDPVQGSAQDHSFPPLTDPQSTHGSHFGDGKKIPMFGPERVVLDKRIAAVHRQVLVDMLWIGLVWGCLFTVLLLGVPGRRW
ncbi:unnamed protein product [Somion occarium]|uniref:RGS domain-containing protein n=1 Tax=Somion occarium TaxID=3059160 RepID=A0ABP1CZL6_9APHY